MRHLDRRVGNSKEGRCVRRLRFAPLRRRPVRREIGRHEPDRFLPKPGDPLRLTFPDLDELLAELPPPREPQGAWVWTGLGWVWTAGTVVASIAYEPIDWALTALEIVQDPSNPYSYMGLIPGVPYWAGKAAKVGKRLPNAYVNTKRVIDMARAPGKVTNAAGWPRNGPWFWRQMLKEYPEMFSSTNRARNAGDRIRRRVG